MKNKALRSLITSLVVIVVVLAAIFVACKIAIASLLSGGILRMSDIQGGLANAAPQFIPVGVLIVLIIIGLIVFWKRGRKFNFWFKWESFIVTLLAIIIAFAVTMLGPMSNLMSLNMAKLNSVSAATLKNSTKVATEVTDEGTVLLKNTDNFLPMTNTSNINVFGWASSNPLYGGSGSGGGHIKNPVDIYKGLQQFGFKTNNDLLKFYQKYRADRPNVGMGGQDWTLPEPAASTYPADLMNKAKSFSDTALVVFSRSGGEGADLPQDMSKLSPDCSKKPQGFGFGGPATYCGNQGDYKPGESYLQLSKSERDMLGLVNKDFKNVIVLIDSANPIESGFINDYSNIKSALWMAGPGDVGFASLGRILRGTVSPSGKTVDTWLYKDKDSPTYNNFGDFHFANDKKLTYVNYVEGIYVGYKYFETRYQGDEAGYAAKVQFPFGYGLSYTNFERTMSDLTPQGADKLSFTVTVKNTGKVAGKDAAEIYFTAPYTNGGLEKASTNLLTVKKTKTLQPGESQVLDFTVNRQDMASYDSKADGGKGAYVLEKGDYKVELKSDSHHVLASKSFSVADTVTYSGSNKRSSDKKVAKNEFADSQGDVKYLSRKDNFANFAEVTKAPTARTASAELKKAATVWHNHPIQPSNAPMPTTGKNNGMKLSDLRGKSYDDPAWQKLLDQMSVSELANLVNHGGYQTVGVGSIGLAHTYTFDGPSGISSMFGATHSTTFPVAAMIAATWNPDLAKQRGQAVGQEGNDMGVDGWYGPAMDLHRSPFGGRCFEYYSEDGTLSGIMAAAETAGAKEHGVFAFIKHFAMNEQETNRGDNLTTWDTEQSIREVFLKPYEMAVKQGGATAVMNAFNFIGPKWCGENPQLLNDVLRGEWGFHGLVETDYFMSMPGGYMEAAPALVSGTDLMLSTNGAGLTDLNNPKVVAALRTAAHNVGYTVVNSHAYAKGGDTNLTMPWQATVYMYITIAVVVVVLLQLLAIFLYFRKYSKRALAAKAEKAEVK